VSGTTFAYSFVMGVNMLYTKELDQESSLELLKNSTFGRLACSLENQPYIVPFNFAFDTKEHIYGFSTLGQKILWMRKNPRVCVEVEDITSPNDWTTLVIFGEYEELSGSSELVKLRDYAHELLSSRPMWWKPAYLAGAFREGVEEEPVYFRIKIGKVSGKLVFSSEPEKLGTNHEKVKSVKLSTRGLW